MHPRISSGAMFALAIGLGGCAAIGKEEFKCSAPVGVHCQSMTATFLAAPATIGAGPSAAAGEPLTATALPAPILKTAVAGVDSPRGRMPLRSEPRLLRMWVKAWEDSDGDFHDSSYIYMPLDAGRWVVPHNSSVKPTQFMAIEAPSSHPAPAAQGAPKIDPKEVSRSATTFARSLGRTGGEQ